MYTGKYGQSKSNLKSNSGLAPIIQFPKRNLDASRPYTKFSRINPIQVYVKNANELSKILNENPYQAMMFEGYARNVIQYDIDTQFTQESDIPRYDPTNEVKNNITFVPKKRIWGLERN